jgi:hypothetical protein
MDLEVANFEYALIILFRCCAFPWDMGPLLIHERAG